MGRTVMTVHEGLSKIKLYNSKVEKEIRYGNICPIMLYRDKDIENDKSIGIKVDEFKNSENGRIASILAMIKNKRAIKRAIVLSNAKTKIELDGVEYTVAELIDMRNDLELTRVAYLSLKDKAEKKELEQIRNNEKVTEEAYSLLAGSLEGADKLKASLIKDYEQANTWKAAKMYGYDELMEQLEKEIDMFESEIDFKLSTSNALTTIEVNLM